MVVLVGCKLLTLSVLRHILVRREAAGLEEGQSQAGEAVDILCWSVLCHIPVRRAQWDWETMGPPWLCIWNLPSLLIWLICHTVGQNSFTVGMLLGR